MIVLMRSHRDLQIFIIVVLPSLKNQTGVEMSDRFANVFWSPDFSSGIEQLNEQCGSSIDQLVEIEKLIHGYVHFFYINSEYLRSFADKSTIQNTSFLRRSPDSLDRNLEHQLKISNDKDKEDTRNLNQKEVDAQDGGDEKAEEDESCKVEDTDKFSIALAYSVSGRNISKGSLRYAELATMLDAEVLSSVKEFIRQYEPHLREVMSYFDALVKSYQFSFARLENLRCEYEEWYRAQEYEMEGGSSRGEEEESDSGDSREEPSSEKEGANENDLDRLVNSHFEIPLWLGSLSIQTLDDFIWLFESMFSSIGRVGRSIPIPGYYNEIFSSNQLCAWLSKTKPFNFNPSLLNMEKFGQSLIDHKLIVGFGIWSKKFRSDNLWFEWSDFVYSIIDYKKNIALNTEKSNMSISSSTTENTLGSPRARNGGASEKFNNLLRTVKQSVLKSDHKQKIKELGRQYNEAYASMQRIRASFESVFLDKSQTLEKFEKSKVELIYWSLATLHKLIYDYSSKTTDDFAKVSSTFLSNNTQQNRDNDYLLMIQNYKSGIYFPTTFLTKNYNDKPAYAYSQDNTFQNIKYRYNMYKDISLQPKLSGSTLESSSLSVASLPYFLYRIVDLIEGDNIDYENFQFYWLLPLDFNNSWEIKNELSSIIRAYRLKGDTETLKEDELFIDITDNAFNFLETLDPMSLINFFKFWLLEIGDSLIPYVVYDSLLNKYQNQAFQIETDEKRVNELVKVLSVLPRSNLSSLIFLLEHISKVFKLDLLQNFGLSDDVSISKGGSTEVALEAVASQLNSMDTIGKIPFLHLIFRPPALKVSSGFKPKIELYNIILRDLLNSQVRLALLGKLIENENKYLTKKAKENSKLPLSNRKVPQASEPSTSNRSMSGSQSNTEEGFHLRPFKTKVTNSTSPHME